MGGILCSIDGGIVAVLVWPWLLFLLTRLVFILLAFDVILLHIPARWIYVLCGYLATHSSVNWSWFILWFHSLVPFLGPFFGSIYIFRFFHIVRFIHTSHLRVLHVKRITMCSQVDDQSSSFNQMITPYIPRHAVVHL